MQNVTIGRQRAFAALPLLVLCIGCGGADSLDTIPIRGKVTFAGDPVAAGEVRYVPKDGQTGRVARGVLQPDGSFQLTTLTAGDGAQPGEYQIVVIVYQEQFDDQAVQHHRRLNENKPGFRQAAATSNSAEPPIPPRYYQPETSGLSDTVDSTHSGFKEIELTP